jgi:hypothetical protein
MKIVLLYDSYINDHDIDNAITNFEKCQGMIGINTSSIKKFSILMNQNADNFRKSILSCLAPNGGVGSNFENLFVICIVSKDE